MNRNFVQSGQIPEFSFHEFMLSSIEHHATRDVNRIAVEESATGERTTYARLLDDVHSLEKAFDHLLHIQKSDVILTAVHNCYDFIPICLSCLGRGAILSGINPASKPNEIRRQLLDSTAFVVLADKDSLNAVLEACRGLGSTVKTLILIGEPSYAPSTSEIPIIRFDELLVKGRSMTDMPRKVAIDPRTDLCLLPYSSGTTGVPKGVMLSRNGGYVCGSYKAKFLYASPPIVQFLSKTSLDQEFDLSSLSMIICGSAPLGQEAELLIKRKIPSIVKIGQGYGLTETGLATHVAGFDGRPGNGGRQLVNVEVKIVDTETGASLPHGRSGEICCRTPTNMIGYWNRPEATRAIFDSDQFLHTGDIGYSDENGYIYIVDRIKELIKVNAFQVAPADLESVLLSHPSVFDCAVIGVPDSRFGEVPRAFVVKKHDDVTEDQLKMFIEERVSPYKRLAGGVRFVAEIPKSPSGKILRRLLRDMSNETKAKL